MKRIFSIKLYLIIYFFKSYSSFSSSELLDLPDIPACSFSFHHMEKVEDKAYRVCNYKKIIGISKNNNFTGKGVKIAIIDLFDHNTIWESLTAQEGKNQQSGFENVAEDDDPHGQNVAGIVKDIAPGAEVIVNNTLDQWFVKHGEDTHQQLANKIRESVDKDVDFINISLCIGGLLADKNQKINPLISEALAYAVEKKVGIIVSAGNEEGLIYPQSLEFIQNMDGWIRFVMAADYSTHEYSAAFNNRPLQEELKSFILSAPGVNIIRRDVTGKTSLYKGSACWEGTSVAAPMVTAAAALIKEMSPSLSAKEVLDLLWSTARTTRLFQVTQTFDNDKARDIFYRNPQQSHVNKEKHLERLRRGYMRKLHSMLLDWENFGAGVLNVKNAIKKIKESNSAPQ